jgi:hypothetical protein
MGVYNILFMMEKGELPAAERPQLMATYMAGIFRAVRWGAGEATAGARRCSTAI